MINEDLARRNKENYSFSDYKEGSATNEYNGMVKEATKKIKKAKKQVSGESKTRLDALLERYKTNMANWINKHNANGANHVSVAIAGPANYNMNKHRKWEQREGKLWEEYNKISDIDSQINKIINGDSIIKSDDKEAIQKLKDKLQKEEDEHQKYKEYNIKAKKEGKDKLPSYMLQNSNARIRNIKNRIAKLEKVTTQDTKEIEINGIRIVDNVEANRLQIIFDGKPDQETRTILKRHGFKWSPRNMAWQRFRSLEAMRIARQICEDIK